MKRICVFLVVLACSAVHAMALPRASFPPIGYAIFCIDNPGHCRPAKATLLPHDARALQLVNRINREVNAAIRPRADVGERWSVFPASGDCEDYALTKRARLISAGVAPGALRIATVKTAAGENHAVLIVKTTSGDFVLDNLRRQIVRRHVAGYHHWRIASENPMQWE